MRVRSRARGQLPPRDGQQEQAAKRDGPLSQTAKSEKETPRASFAGDRAKISGASLAASINQVPTTTRAFSKARTAQNGAKTGPKIAAAPPQTFAIEERPQVVKCCKSLFGP